MYRLVSEENNADSWTVRIYIFAAMFSPLLFNPQACELPTPPLLDPFLPTKLPTANESVAYDVTPIAHPRECRCSRV